MRKDIERQKELEPKRMDYAIQELEKLGITIFAKDDKKLSFEHKGGKVTLYYYSGWFSGKTVMDGMGIDNLLFQLRTSKQTT